MVAPQQEEVSRVLDLVGEHETDALQRLLSPVHIVPQKQVAPLLWLPKQFKQPQKITKLPMNIPAYLHRSLQLQQHRLLLKYVTRHHAEPLHLELPETEVLLRGVSLLQFSDDVVNAEDLLPPARPHLSQNIIDISLF